MAVTPKKDSKTTESGSAGTWAEDQREHDYYYDDSHGYQVYDPDAEDEDYAGDGELTHKWDVTAGEAIELQKQLAHKVIREDELPAEIKTVAGIDLGYKTDEDKSRAVVAVLSFPELMLIETQEAILPIQFPYIPGLLSFREIPVLIEAVAKLENKPDIILYDGVGIAHPRRFGIASHVGVVTGIPTIGVAKSILIGKHGELGEKRGSTARMIDKGEHIGTALRTKDNVKPVYVSIGHKISLKTSLKFVLACAQKYRLPETTRIADRLASYRKSGQLPLFED